MRTKAQREAFERRLQDWSDGNVTFDTPDTNGQFEITNQNVLSVKSIMNDSEKLSTLSYKDYMKLMRKHSGTIAIGSSSVLLLASLLAVTINPLAGLAVIAGAMTTTAITMPAASKIIEPKYDADHSPINNLKQIYLDTNDQSLHYAFTRIDRNQSTTEHITLDIPESFIHESKVTGNAKEAIELYKLQTTPTTENVVQYVKTIVDSIVYENERDIQNILDTYYKNSPTPIDTPLYKSLKDFSDQHQKTIDDGNNQLNHLISENEHIVMGFKSSRDQNNHSAPESTKG